jgi:hypothetical protein
MKKLLLTLLLSFSYTGSALAECQTAFDFLIPKIEKYHNCVEVLKKEDMNNAEELCINKYAKKIDWTCTDVSQEGANKSGAFSEDVENLSSNFVIKQIGRAGYFRCKDETKCDRQYYEVSKYVSIPPGSKETVYFHEHEEDIEIPDDVKYGEWTWNISSRWYSGFRILY